MGERDEESKGKAGKERHDYDFFLSVFCPRREGRPRSEEKCLTKILVFLTLSSRLLFTTRLDPSPMHQAARSRGRTRRA